MLEMIETKPKATLFGFETFFLEGLVTPKVFACSRSFVGVVSSFDIRISNFSIANREGVEMRPNLRLCVGSVSSRAAIDGEGPLNCNCRYPSKWTRKFAAERSFIVCAIQDDTLFCKLRIWPGYSDSNFPLILA